MNDLWTVRRFAQWFFDLPDDVKPTKAQINSINARCREGKLPAVKIGGSWRVDTSEILRMVKHENKQSGAE